MPKIPAAVYYDAHPRLTAHGKNIPAVDLTLQAAILVRVVRLVEQTPGLSMPLVRSLFLRPLQAQIIGGAALNVGVHPPASSTAAPDKAVAKVSRPVLSSQFNAAAQVATEVQRKLENLDTKHPKSGERQKASEHAERESDCLHDLLFLRGLP